MTVPDTRSAYREYAEAAVARECAAVANAPPHQANNCLHRAAVALGTLEGAGLLDRAEAEARLVDAAALRGKSRNEARATIKSGMDWGRSHPREPQPPTGQRQQAVPKSVQPSRPARLLWDRSAAISGTPAEAYLRSRGITGALPASLRFSSAVRMPCGAEVPAMVASVTVPSTGQPLAVQRTALKPDGSGKAEIEKKKAALGKTAGGAVVFGDLTHCGPILEGEGIETVLSACFATGLPGIATLGATTLGKPRLPDGSPVIILGDVGSEEAARKGAARRKDEGREVRIAYPPAGSGKDFNDVLCSGGAADVKAAIDAAQAYECGSDMPKYSARCLADVEARPVRWLWPKRIARGKLNLVAGHPGRGKSQLTLHLAALVSNGGTWPDGSSCPRGSVIIITCEDEAADTIVPRLKAAGADIGRCHQLDGDFDRDGKVRPFSVDAGLAGLSSLMADLGDVALIIIDPVSAYLGKVDSHNNAEVRGALAPLQAIAEESGAAVVFVSHFNKGTADSSAMSRVAGSGAFVAVCRSAWLVERDPEDSEERRRLLVPMKNNIGDDKTGFRFEIEHVELGKDITASRVKFLPGEVRLSADELVRGASQSELPKGQRDEAVEFLQDLLSAAPMPQSEVKASAGEAGIKWRTIERAKKQLGIRSRRVEKRWAWSLPDAARMTSDLFETTEQQAVQQRHVRQGRQAEGEPVSGGLVNGATFEHRQPECHAIAGGVGGLGVVDACGSGHEGGAVGEAQA